MLVAVDELVSPTIGDVLVAVGLPLAATYVDGRLVDPAASAADHLVDGATITPAGESVPATVPVVGLAVVAGPDAGRVTSLDAGAHVVGRDLSSTVAVDDRTVSRRHLEIRVTDDTAAVNDLESLNGSRTGDAWIVTASPVIPKALIHVGASSLRFHALPGPSAPVGPVRGGRIAFVRPPRQQLPAAQPIAPPPRAHGASRRLAIDVVAIAVPVLFALLMAVAFDPRFALMGLIGPVLAISNHLGQRRRVRRDDAQREITERQARTRFRNDVLAARAAHSRDVH
jgi:S-DNA-T family DNA segregation ATPase FtsK/SpoIIIE